MATKTATPKPTIKNEPVKPGLGAPKELTYTTEQVCKMILKIRESAKKGYDKIDILLVILGERMKPGERITLDGVPFEYVDNFGDGKTKAFKASFFSRYDFKEVPKSRR